MLSNHVVIRRSTLQILSALAREKGEGTLARAAVAEAETCLNDAGRGLHLMLDASTAHLSDADRGLLERLSGGVSEDFSLPRVVNHEYGWSIFLSNLEETQEIQSKALRSAGASTALVQLIERGAEAECLILNFDADADLVPDIPVAAEYAVAV